MNQSKMNTFIEDMIRPYTASFSEYDVIKNMGGDSSSPAVAAVKKLRRESNNQSYQSMKKDAHVLANMAMTQNPDIVHDVAGRKEMRDLFEKPSKYVNGISISEIREQERLLKQYSSVKPGFVTPSRSKIDRSAMAHSYRNDLDSQFTQKLVTPDEVDKKPKYDWVKGIRKQILIKMKEADQMKKKNLVHLSKILTHQKPSDVFTELKNVYEDGNELKMDWSDMIEAMLCYI